MEDMNKDEIMRKVEEILDERTGNKAGCSGHLSSVYISDINIIEIKEEKTSYEVKVTYTVDVLSEFDVAEETDPDSDPDPDDPYHYKKTETLLIKK